MSAQMNVPKLRFPEFSGEWVEKKVGEISKTIIAGGTPSTLKEEYWNGDIRWMSSGELNFKKVYEVNGRITEIGLKKSSTKMIPIGCILIGLAGQGKTRGTVAMNMVELCTNQSIASIFPNDKIFHNNFLYHDLDRRYDELRKLSTGDGGRGGLNLQIIKSLTVNLPNLSEQQKIATFLTAIDTKIEQLTKKQTLLKQYKKGVMQKLFSQELRFKADDGSEFSEWEEKKLGKIARITTGSSNRQDSNLDGEFTFFDRSQDIRTSDRFLFDAEAIIVPGEGQEFIPKYFKGKFDLHQRTYAIMDFKDINGIFLFYSISFNSNHLNSHAVGSTVKSLRLPMFETMPINLPSLFEQEKIANFLTAIDTKIDLATKQLEATKQFKKALLQQMFV
jgi:type I restriction enzyme S subunit